MLKLSEKRSPNADGICKSGDSCLGFRNVCDLFFVHKITYSNYNMYMFNIINFDYQN